MSLKVLCRMNEIQPQTKSIYNFLGFFWVGGDMNDYLNFLRDQGVLYCDCVYGSDYERHASKFADIGVESNCKHLEC